MDKLIKFFPWSKDFVTNQNTFDMLLFSNSVKLGIITLIIFLLSFYSINNVKLDASNRESGPKKQTKIFYGYLFMIGSSLFGWNYWVMSSLITNESYADMFLKGNLWISIVCAMLGYIVLSVIVKFAFKKSRYSDLKFK